MINSTGKPEKKSETKSDLGDIKKLFNRCKDHESDNRNTALEDIKFARLGEQWPADILKQRELDNRPSLTINKLPTFIRQVVNDSRQNKPSITVHPVDDKADPETAAVLSGILRNIESVSNADAAYDTGVEQAVTSGFGYWRISIDYGYQDAFDLDIKIDRVINPFSVFGDPYSTAVDSSDWDICFVTDRISKDEFKRRYKGKADVNFESDGWSEAKGTDWLNEDGVLIAEYWKREEIDKEIVQLSDGRVFSTDDLEATQELQDFIAAGSLQISKKRTIKAKKVTQTFLTGAEVLETIAWPGCYIPIIPVYGDEILLQGKRYFRSLIHNAIDAQRMFNYWRTTATELIALAPRVPFIGPKGAFDEDPNWQNANKASFAYLEYDGPVEPTRQPLDTGPAGGILQEALNSSDDMKAIMGIYDASLGARSNETSGRAIMARQREGDVATFHFIDNVTRAIRHTGRVIIDLIPHVYSGPRIMRILGEDGTPKNVQVNKPYQKMPGQGAAQPEQGQQSPGPIGQPPMGPMGPGPGQPPMGQPAMGPDPMDGEVNETQTAIIGLHDLTVGKYDVIVKSGPSFTSRREEAAMQMTEFVRSFPQAAPVIGDLMARNFDWPGADEIAARLAKMNPSNQPPPPPPGIPLEVQQQIQQGQQMIQQLQAENQQLKQDMEAGAAKVKMAADAKMAEMEQTAALEKRKQDIEFELATRRLQQDKDLKLFAMQLEPAHAPVISPAR